jgi:hypothetical protein
MVPSFQRNDPLTWVALIVIIRALQATENLGTLKPLEGADNRDKGFNGRRDLVDLA